MTVKAFAPASISNLGPGFDVIGLALEKPGDIATATRFREPGLRFSVAAGGTDVPADPARNVAARVASLLLDECRPGFGVRLVLKKMMPVGSGLGSSAASGVAALMAVNALLPKPLKRIDLLRFAVEGERMTSGSGHADNVAPSLLGGVCLVRSYSPLDIIRVPIRNRISWVVVHPHVVVRTEDARTVVPMTVPIGRAIHQWGNVGGLIVGLVAGDPAIVGKCVDDVIVEPARAHLVPGFATVKEAALAAGATGCSLSGSGPAMFAVSPGEKEARRIARAMKDAFASTAHRTADVYISRVNLSGATLVGRS